MGNCEMCENCKFYASQCDFFGVCRKRAPVQEGGGTRFPNVRPIDWCGDWEEKVE